MYFQSLKTDKFMELMASSYIVIVPLLKDYASGLVVIKKAIQMGKIVISTKISAVKNYYPTDLQYLLVPVGDYEQILFLINMIDNFSEEEYIETVDKHKNFVRKKFSPYVTTNKIIEILKNSFFMK